MVPAVYSDVCQVIGLGGADHRWIPLSQIVATSRDFQIQRYSLFVCVCVCVPMTAFRWCNPWVIQRAKTSHAKQSPQIVVLWNVGNG